jgi:hypothetical protein
VRKNFPQIFAELRTDLNAFTDDEALGPMAIDQGYAREIGGRRLATGLRLCS